jgi:hypothetical protein
MATLKLSERIVKGRLSQIGQPFRVKTKNGNVTYAVFACDCGKKLVTTVSRVKRESTTSCGCFAKELVVKRNTTHGLTSSVTGRKTLQAWNSMWGRCTNPNVESYATYGGRGISVCDRWKSFDAFLEDMGVAAKDESLDRIDGSLGYFPENCRWSTSKEQAINRSTTVFIQIGDTVKTMTDWALQNKIPISTVYGRLHRGWSKADAVSSPSRPYRKAAK